MGWKSWGYWLTTKLLERFFYIPYTPPRKLWPQLSLFEIYLDMYQASLVCTVQFPNAINREVIIQELSCAVYENKLEKFFCLPKVVNPKFTALMLYFTSLPSLQLLYRSTFWTLWSSFPFPLPCASTQLSASCLCNLSIDGWAHAVSALIKGSTRTICKRVTDFSVIYDIDLSLWLKPLGKNTCEIHASNAHVWAHCFMRLPIANINVVLIPSDTSTKHKLCPRQLLVLASLYSFLCTPWTLYPHLKDYQNHHLFN